MRVVLDEYINTTSGHCGSGSMQDLLRHYCHLDLSEGVVFGLGSGIDAMYMSAPTQNPGVMMIGRSGTMEADLARNLGLDYHEQIEADDEKAWELVREDVANGKPTMISGDIYYLDYRRFKVHFPGHRFVLVGFDDEACEVYLADRTDVDIQTCTAEGLRLSRNSPAGMSTHNLWGQFRSGRVAYSLEAACESALNMSTARMLGQDKSQIEIIQLLTGGHGFAYSGLEGLRHFSEDLANWQQRHSDPAMASYLLDTIVNFGTGGACFRTLYKDFLGWACDIRPDLVDPIACDAIEASAHAWDRVAEEAALLKADPANPTKWQAIDADMQRIIGAETQLFEHLTELSKP